ncbi:MAG: MBL fold metallo-hydrolase [Lachnospiraceae bacterium]|nr:MBL fold metallo-hydrolase [Lachnospiraceae bacterium]
MAQTGKTAAGSGSAAEQGQTDGSGKTAAGSGPAAEQGQTDGSGKTAAGSGSAAEQAQSLGLNADMKDPTQYTVEENNKVYALLDFDDERELENAQRGLISAPDSLVIKDENGKVVWSQDAYSCLAKDAPESANPSLWRNAQFNHIYGLFEVVDGIYQVRGYDMSNITFIKGNTGWIVYDPLMTVECAKAAYELVKEEIGDYPVKAVLYSHSHVDHFGGVEGIVSEEQVKKEGIKIIAPEGFEEHAVAENIYAGNAMARRASYQYGTLLGGGETGSLCIGIGMGQSKGTTSYISPNTTITKTGQKLTIDGVEMEFQLTPGTEAPAEMNTWFPQKKALWMAENCTGTLHNLYTLRGAQVRDGQAWAEYLMETLKLYGDKADVVFQAHNWPHWDNENIKEYITNTAAVYKFINDQTLYYLNLGYTSTEIANMIKLPAELEKVWYTRQYYGTVAHNSKAVYQKFMGWYDANPVHLGQLPPEESAKKYVEYLGDTDKALRKAKEDYDKGEYQWVAEITNVLVYADPDNKDARYLCADALEQLGYQAESGTWRNAYLCAAQELRNGTNTDEATRASTGGALITHMTPDMILQYLGIITDTMKIQDLSFKANIILPDITYGLVVKNGVVMYEKDTLLEDADVTWTTDKPGLFGIIQKNEEAVKKNIKQEGDETLLTQLMEGITGFGDAKYFEIIEP